MMEHRMSKQPQTTVTHVDHGDDIDAVIVDFYRQLALWLVWAAIAGVLIYAARRFAKR